MSDVKWRNDFYCESFGVPLFGAGAEKSCDSAVGIIEITVFRGGI
jgi:hypothetical protein